jgi:hypothetical protein
MYINLDVLNSHITIIFRSLCLYWGKLKPAWRYCLFGQSKSGTVRCSLFTLLVSHVRGINGDIKCSSIHIGRKLHCVEYERRSGEYVAPGSSSTDEYTNIPRTYTTCTQTIDVYNKLKRGRAILPNPLYRAINKKRPNSPALYSPSFISYACSNIFYVWSKHTNKWYVSFKCNVCIYRRFRIFWRVQMVDVMGTLIPWIPCCNEMHDSHAIAWCTIQTSHSVNFQC